MIARRRMVASTLGATTIGMVDAALGQPYPEQKETENGSILRSFGFVGPTDDPEFGPLIRGQSTAAGAAVGTEPARHDEVVTAFRLLLGSRPQNPQQANGHLDSARYLGSIRNVNRDGELYNQEWRIRANPLIIGLFSMTNTLPANGDHTSWCAAFVNYCLFLAEKRGTFSALSGSFRNYAEATNNPQPGDIVVFSAYGQAGRNGFGHVGFFTRQEGDSVWVLGGNQGGGIGPSGAITEVRFPFQGRDLSLHSFRKIPNN